MTNDNGPRVTFAMVILGVMLAFAGISEIAFGLTKTYLARNIPHATASESPGQAMAVPLATPATEHNAQTDTTAQPPSPGATASITDKATQ